MLPLLAFLLAAPLSSLASIPPDPFAHPKYKLSFLNDLPIESSVAQRWIASGLPHDDSGGVGVFFGERTKTVGSAELSEAERVGIDEEREVEELVGGGGGDEAELELNTPPPTPSVDQIVLSPPSSDLSQHQHQTEPSESSTPPSASNYTLQHLLLPPGPRAYLCLLPPPPPPLSDLPPPPPVPPMDPGLPEKLLQHLKGTCLYMKQGWFTYAYCHGVDVKQFREAARPWPPLPGGFVPKIDENYDDYSLGRAVADINADQNLPPIALGRGAGQRYLVQRWGGGTVCDKTNRGREIEVQFHCSMTGTDSIGLIKEVSTCNYILMINTPRLCNIPGFSSTHLSEPPSGINCREIVADGSLPKREIDADGTTTSKHRTPLPSWAILPPAPLKPAPSKADSKSTPFTPKPVPDGASPEVRAILQRVLAQMTGTIPLADGVTAEDLVAGLGQPEPTEEEQAEADEGGGVVHLRVEQDPETGEVRVVTDPNPDEGLPTYSGGELELDYNDYSDAQHEGHNHDGHHHHHSHTHHHADREQRAKEDAEDDEEDRRYVEELKDSAGLEGEELERLVGDLEEEERGDEEALRRFEARIGRRRRAREGLVGRGGVGVGRGRGGRDEL